MTLTYGFCKSYVFGFLVSYVHVLVCAMCGAQRVLFVAFSMCYTQSSWFVLCVQLAAYI